MKKFFVPIICAALLFGSTNADAARYFMQGDTKGSTTPYGDNLRVGKYVQADDAKIYYEVYGKGAPVLILHGAAVSAFPTKWAESLTTCEKIIKLS